MAPMLRSRPQVVVLGMMSRTPVPGVVFQTLHYLLGLEALGLDVYYVEDHGMTPTAFFGVGSDDGWKAAVGFVARVMDDFGLAGRWAYHAEHGGGRHFGMSASELAALYRSAALLLNLHGSTRPRPEQAATGRLVYVETDPVEVQVQLAHGQQDTIDYLDAHVAWFTFGESYGTPGCRLPVSDRFDFWPTRQPVVLDLWDRGAPAAGELFTTIGNWRQTHRDVELGGDTYRWTKDLEFRRFLDLPRRTGASFELALSSCDDDDAAMLAGHGWRTRAPFLGYGDLDAYRDFILSSAGEFTVAKEQNVALRTGWFSDRSATYLAAGRPVITQDTGFGAHLETGKGLFPFTDLDEAQAAVEEVRSNPSLHRRAAQAIAAEHFAAPAVLGDMLDRLGMRPAGRRRGGRSPFGLPPELPVRAVGHWPTTLAESTTALVEARIGLRLREAAGRRVLPTLADRPAASVVVVTHGGTPFVAMCLESLLAAADTDGTAVEVVVVDNASPDGTVDLLHALARLDPRVRVLAQPENLGFAGANNVGIAAARGDDVVLLNSDTVVTPGWLATLLAHLDDPSVALAGPVTNRTGNEAEVDAPYRTFGELAAHAAARREARAGERFDIPMLAMFCVAGRRATFARLGPLDEGYGLGMFEDEDYAARARAAGLRLVCAEDCFVHHFGQASLGKVLDPAAYEDLFAANRARFESRWGVSWQPHRRRPPEGYQELARRVRARVEQVTPPGATVLVAAKGDDAFLALEGRTGWHFPGTASGRFAGEYPPDSGAAVEGLHAQAAAGADYLVFPSTSAWWLEHYGGLAAHLAADGPPVHGDEDCTVWRLSPPGAAGDATLRRIVAAQADELARMRQELATVRDLVVAATAVEAAPAPPGPETSAALAASGGQGELWQALDRLMEETGASKRTRYLSVRARLRAALCDRVPPGGVVAVVSHGDDELVALPGRTGWHVPRLPDGAWGGGHPADGTEAVLHLDVLAAFGADYFALPAPYAWWLDQYPELARHLERVATPTFADPAVGWLWSLGAATGGAAPGTVGRLEAEARRRLGGADPTILDWDSGLDMAASFPELTVFSPPGNGASLPYLDGTVDVVVLPAGDRGREAEAARVASLVVATVDGAGSVEPRWQRPQPETSPPSTSVVLLGDPTPRALTRVSRAVPAGDAFELLVPRSLAGRHRGVAAACRVREVEVPSGRPWAQAALAAAGGDLVAVVDGGAIPLTGWLDELRPPLVANRRVGAASAPAVVWGARGTFEGRTPEQAVLVARRNLVVDGGTWDRGLTGVESVAGRARAAGGTVVTLDVSLAVASGGDR